MKQTVKTVAFRCAISLGLLAQLSIMLPAHAEIFKCTNKQGKVYYNDKPCPVESDEEKLQNEKDPVNGYVPDFSDKKKASSKKSFIKPDSKIDEDAPLDNSDKPDSTDHTGYPKKRLINSGTRSTGGTQNANHQINHKPPPPAKKRVSPKLTIEEKKTLLGIHQIPQ